jgi:uncharacterized membrane protein
MSSEATMGGDTATHNRNVKLQNEIIRKNISAINEVQRKEAGARSSFDRVADGITTFSGSIAFVIIHIIWFGLWVLLNVHLVRIPHLSEFDPFPFSLLTMVVSLEAIFLSTFVLISQNRMARLSEQRAELDLHVNLLAEQKATKALEMLDQLTQQLNSLNRFNFDHDPEVQALKVSPEPQEVLQVMKEAIKEEAEGVREEVKEEIKEKVDKVVDEITGEMEAVHEEVRDITGETKAVRKEVADVREKVKAVAGDMHEMKAELKERTGEHEEVSAK